MSRFDEPEAGAEGAAGARDDERGRSRRRLPVMLFGLIFFVPLLGVAMARGEGNMKGWVSDIEKHTIENGDFRRVLYTGKNLQLVLMAIPPGGEIGEEVHDDGDQFFRVESGKGEVLIDGRTTPIEDDFAVVVPAGARHNVRNTGKEPLKLYTVYGPPEHVDGTVHRTKAEADASHEHFDGKTTE